jgi:hypothetical protein
MIIKYLAHLPNVVGHDLLYPNRALAEREILNAAKGGYDITGACITEVLLRTPVGRAA